MDLRGALSEVLNLRRGGRELSVLRRLTVRGRLGQGLPLEKPLLLPFEIPLWLLLPLWLTLKKPLCLPLWVPLEMPMWLLLPLW
ncbi:hypothetical protein FKM82_018950 [Ascaphus truei]